MLTENIIGKTVTNIFSLVTMEVGGLDTGECFIELDNETIIDIPFGFDDEILIKELDKKAVSLFVDLSDYPVYHINKDNRTVGEIANKYQKQKRNIVSRLCRYLFGSNIAINDYQVYKIEYREKKIKHIKNRKIVDFLCYSNDNDKGFILLDNGFLITEITVAMHGTGLAGLNLYERINDLINAKGNNYSKLTEIKGFH
jgi:hypothetical protein